MHWNNRCALILWSRTMSGFFACHKNSRSKSYTHSNASQRTISPLTDIGNVALLVASCWRVWVVAEMLCAVDSAFWVMVDEDWCVTIASIMVVCEEGGDGVGESGCCGDGLLSGVSLAGMFSEEEVVEADGGAYWNSRPVIWYSKLAISSVSQSDRWRDDNCNSPMINCWNENRWSCDMVDVGVEHSNSLNFNSKWPEKNFARDSPLPLKLIFLGLILGRCIDELDYGGRGPKTDSEGKKKN